VEAKRLLRGSLSVKELVPSERSARLFSLDCVGKLTASSFDGPQEAERYFPVVDNKGARYVMIKALYIIQYETLESLARALCL
jgi:hypothetical protein